MATHFLRPKMAGFIDLSSGMATPQSGCFAHQTAHRTDLDWVPQDHTMADDDAEMVPPPIDNPPGRMRIKGPTPSCRPCLSRPASSYCHDLRSAHYSRVLSVQDLSAGSAGSSEHKHDDGPVTAARLGHDGEARGSGGELASTLRTVSAALTDVSKSVVGAVLRGVEGSVADAVAAALSGDRE